MIENIKEIPTHLIIDPKDAMRTDIDRDAIFELADNIKANGLINPITVRPVGDKYEVVAGHRRMLAHRYGGMPTIKCVVRELDDNQTFAVMAAENLERSDVDPVDESIFITKYIEQTNASVPEVAKALHRSVAFVESRLAVGLMPDYLQHYLKTGAIKLGVALTLVQITDDDMRRVWVDLAVRDGISIAQAEYWLHGWKVNQLPGGTVSQEPPEGYTPEEPKLITFRCAIDGKDYDCRQFRTYMIHESNVPFFNEMVRAFNAPAEEV